MAQKLNLGATWEWS